LWLVTGVQTCALPIYNSGSTPPPKEIAAAAEKMISEIVTARDCPEHRANFDRIALIRITQCSFSLARGKERVPVPPRAKSRA